MTERAVTGTSTKGAARPVGRPRSARADAAILDAVLELLADGASMESLSMEAVAAQAGVGKATIYRRWPNKAALVADAIDAVKGPLPELAGRSVRDDLVTLLAAIGQPATDRNLHILRCVMPEVHRSPELYQRVMARMEERQGVTREVLRRGVRTGELRADLDVELALNLFVGPVLVQKLIGWNPRLDTRRLAERVVDTLLAGLSG